MLQLVWPSLEYLPSYMDALERGWSPDNMRPEAGRQELARIGADPAVFLAEQVDRDARGSTVELPDGSVAARIPGYRRWIWDGDFCGVIGFRWQPGTNTLPAHVLGHIGFAVVPWKRGRGYATQALAQLLRSIPDERLGLEYVELTTDVTNLASQRVITKNGGRLVEHFTKAPMYGGTEGLRFRIDLGE